MSAPQNPDSRPLPPGWIQQYNWDYRQWFYVNMREQPPRSSWEHPAGLAQDFAPPLGPPPSDRAYNRSPYANPPSQGYGGYGYQQQPQQPQGYYNAPGGYGGGPQSGNRAFYPEQQVVYEQQPKQKKGPGLGTALLAGGAGLVGGALLMDAIEDHDDREREIGYDQGFQDGFDDNQGGDWGGW